MKSALVLTPVLALALFACQGRGGGGGGQQGQQGEQGQQGQTGGQTGAYGGSSSGSSGGGQACAQLSSCYSQLQQSLCSGDTKCQSTFDPQNVPKSESSCSSRLSNVQQQAQPYMQNKAGFSLPQQCQPSGQSSQGQGSSGSQGGSSSGDQGSSGGQGGQ